MVTEKERTQSMTLTLYALTFKCDWQASQYKDNSSSVSLAVCCTFIQTHSLRNLWSTMSLETKFWGKRPFWGLSFDFDPQWYLTDEQKEIQRRLIELCRTTLRRNAVSFALQTLWTPAFLQNVIEKMCLNKRSFNAILTVLKITHESNFVKENDIICPLIYF